MSVHGCVRFWSRASDSDIQAVFGESVEATQEQ